MKRKLLLLLVLICGSTYAQCVFPVVTDFECTPASATLGGKGVVSVSNPFSGDPNTSANVGEFTDDGTDPWDNLHIDFGTAIDLSQNFRFNLKVYSTATIQVLVKLQGGTTPAREFWLDISPNTWDEHKINLESHKSEGHDEVIIFFNAGVDTGTTSDVYYIDDIFFDEPETYCEYPLINDFECDFPSHTGGGTALTTIANIDASGANTSPNIGRWVDNGTDGWDGLIISYGEAIDLSYLHQLKVKLYSPTSIKILAKLQGGTTAREIWSDFSLVNTWQEFVFDFSAYRTDGNTEFVLFFNAGETSGTTSDVYYIDDLKFDGILSTQRPSSEEVVVNVYPNPFTDQIQVSSDVDLETYVLKDLTGKVLQEDIIDSRSISIDASDHASGLYFLYVYSNDFEKVFKIIKN